MNLLGSFVLDYKFVCLGVRSRIKVIRKGHRFVESAQRLVLLNKREYLLVNNKLSVQVHPGTLPKLNGTLKHFHNFICNMKSTKQTVQIIFMCRYNKGLETDITVGLPTMKYLASQRNAQGGCHSTQVRRSILLLIILRCAYRIT